MAVTKVVSIEVSDVVTRAVEMDFGKKDPIIHRAIVFTTPDSSVADGVIEQMDVYSKELSAQLKSAGIHTKDCIFTMTSNKVISREVTVPDLKDDQIPEFIENQKSEYFPMDTSGHIMVHRVLERNKEAKQMRMIVFAVPQRIIANYQALAAQCGLKINSIDYNGNSIYQWLSNPLHKEMTMYLQINERSSMFTILEKRTLAIQRNINFGAYNLADRLIQSGYFEGESSEFANGMTRSDAMKKLSQEEFLFPSFATAKLVAPDTEAAERLHNTKEMLTEGLRPLLGNLSRVMEYYHAKNKDAEITTIYIGGAGAKIKGLKTFLENEFAGVETVVLEQLPDLKVSHTMERSGVNTSELIACLGAVDKSLTFVTVSEKEKTAKFVTITAIALLLVIIAAVVLILVGRNKYKKALDKKETLQLTQENLEALHLEDIEADYIAAEARVQAVIDADKSTFRYNEYWNSVLAEVEEKTVTSMVVSSISSSQTGVVFNLNVNSKEAAAKVLMQFATIPYFSNVSTTAIQETYDEETNITTVTFSVNCTYKEYFDFDVNGDGVVDSSDDVNGDGTVDKLDVYGDVNGDHLYDVRDIEEYERMVREKTFELIELDINYDGVIDEADDFNGDGVVDELDRRSYALFEAGIEEETEEGAEGAQGEEVTK